MEVKINNTYNVNYYTIIHVLKQKGLKILDRYK